MRVGKTSRFRLRADVIFAKSADGRVAASEYLRRAFPSSPITFFAPFSSYIAFPFLPHTLFAIGDGRHRIAGVGVMREFGVDVRLSS